MVNLAVDKKTINYMYLYRLLSFNGMGTRSNHIIKCRNKSIERLGTAWEKVRKYNELYHKGKYHAIFEFELGTITCIRNDNFVLELDDNSLLLHTQK